MKKMLKGIIVWILTFEAKLVLKKYKPRIVGVTGSVGKTSTKDAIFTVLGSAFYVRKSQKSFNTELGIPLTVLGCDNAWNNPFLWLKNIFVGLGVILFPNHYPQWLVLEVGLDRPGDIRRVVDWLNFDIVVYSRLSEAPVHVEFFENTEELLAEKKKLIDGLKRGGALVTNKDDDLQARFTKDGITHFTYGLRDDTLVQGSHISVVYEEKKPTGVTFRVDYAGASAPITFSGVLGEQHVYPALAACAVGLSQQVNLVDIGKSFTHHEHVPGRMRILEGVHGSVLIDDSYNASPVAMHAALDVMAELSVGEGEPSTGKGKRICVLGDMTELGELTTPAHEEIGKRVGQIATVFVGVGERMVVATEAAREAGMNTGSIVRFREAKEAIEYLQDLVGPGDVVLIKGSQAMRMEHITKALLARPEQAAEHLVRQEPVWLRK